MFSQHQSTVSDASVKSQSRSGILTPGSDNLSEEPDHGGNGGRKRKRDGNTMDGLLKDTFIIRPIPSTASIKSRKFQPLLLLPRSHLPLSAIDITSSAKTFSKSRLFESHVKVLELEDRMGSQPLVVIAKLDDNSPTLFVVERESRGLYVVLQLGSWINLRQLREVAVASKQDAPEVSGSIKDGQTIPATDRESIKPSRKRLAIEQIQRMVKRPTANLLTESSNTETNPEVTNVPAKVSAPTPDLPNSIALPAPTDELSPQLSGAELFENVRTQYLEALYISKASLAYFAKGPLSRARAAFHLDLDSNLDINEYVTFLESLVMSTTFLDKKYRDGVPTCVSLVDVHDHSGEENQPMKAKKRKTSKKMKLGKNGLYPSEDTLVRKWWETHGEDADLGIPGNSKEELTRTRISLLRIRETQLQMIIVLEILALQPLASAAKDNAYDLPSALPSIEVVDAKEKPVKAKKPDHLSTLIDGHVDRLCIWQSLASESMKGPETVTASIGPGQQSKATDNIPRDFCVEVIIPFFSARLPDRCAAINRKLGGPVPASKSKPKLPKPSSFSGKAARPGAATKRPMPVPRDGRSLQRVLSDDRERRSMSHGPNRKISLMRSATMPSLKRELSEGLSLSSIPTSESQKMNASRGGLSNVNRFAQRVVDLNNLVPAANPKAKQKATVDAELKDAISALKRPNRELAGKSFAETVEQRSTGLAHSRKSKKPIRNPFFQNVQITATPKAVRRKDMGFESIKPSSKLVNSAESSFVPASSLPSGSQVSQKPSNSLPDRNSMFMSVQATPTRKASKSQTTDTGFGGFPPSSPLHVRRSSAQLFTTVPNSITKDTQANFTSHGILETPIKKKQANLPDHSHPVAPAMPSFDSAVSNKENDARLMLSPIPKKVQETPMRKEASIYESLGWDDDNDIDDLA